MEKYKMTKRERYALILIFITGGLTSYWAHNEEPLDYELLFKVVLGGVVAILTSYLSSRRRFKKLQKGKAKP